MDPIVAVAITNAVSVITLAVLGIVGGIITANFNSKLNQAKVERDAASKSTDLQLKEIHTLTNSNWAETKAQLATANDKIVSLREMIAEMRRPSGGGHLVQQSVPVPVTDKASDRVAAATEKLADAAEKAAEK